MIRSPRKSPAPSQVPIRLAPQDSLETVLTKAVAVRPTPGQLAWQRDELSIFLHFGINTFTDREWGDGREDPGLFRPTALDARQWARAARAAGATRMILTAKHHDGFCLWPTRFTEHCVRNSPWKRGRGDVVGEFVAACKAEALRFGIYLSPWDRHEKTYGDSPRYNQFFLNQLRELLTTYPGAAELWFDGACAEGPNGKRQEYDWRAYWSLIRELAPDAVITVRGPDVRWVGNEAGCARAAEWSVIPMPGDNQTWHASDLALSGFTRDIHDDDLGSRDALLRSRRERAALAWYPAQVNTSIRPGWFHHPHEDSRVRSLQDLLAVYYGSVGGNGQFLLGVPPDRRGLFHENDVARLAQLGRVLRQTFASNLAAGARLTTHVIDGHSVGDVARILDDDPDTFWTTTDGPSAAAITAELPAPVRANCLMLQEHIASGQRVEAFAFDLFTDGQWHTAAIGGVIGHKRLLRFADADVTRFRVRFPRFRLRPTLARLGLYFAPAILAAPAITRDPAGTARLDPPVGTNVRYTLDGSTPTHASPLYTGPIPLPEGGLLTARTFPLTPGAGLTPTDSGPTPTDSATSGTASSNNPRVGAAANSPSDSPSDSAADPAVARAEFGLAKEGWTILDCSSQESGAEAQRAIDDDPRTFWLARHHVGADPTPHHVSIDLGRRVTIRGFAYTPRQDPSDAGVVLRARFEVSLDKKAWITAADAIDFDNIVSSRQQQLVRLSAPVAARFFRFTALRTAHDGDTASAAEICVLVR